MIKELLLLSSSLSDITFNFVYPSNGKLEGGRGGATRGVGRNEFEGEVVRIRFDPPVRFWHMYEREVQQHSEASRI